MAPNEIYQFSIISALMDGVASKGIPLSTVLAHGNHGLGTFKNIMGEMILLDGKIYQMMSDGNVTAYDSKDDLAKISPFAMVTDFQATETARTPIASKQALADQISAMLPKAKNHFVAMRLDGVFRRVTVRTAGGQRVPHESLTEVGKNQAEHKFETTRGTIVGFRSPQYMAGIGVVGDHLHFITEDRQHGGHILAVEADEDIKVTASQISQVHLQLPDSDEEFDAAPLVGDAEGIAAIEG